MSQAAPDPTPYFIPLREAMRLVGYSAASGYRFAGLGLIQLTKSGTKTGVLSDELERFREENTRPFVPGETVIANAGGHRSVKPPRQSRQAR
jgi:hypothetical protein